MEYDKRQRKPGNTGSGISSFGMVLLVITKEKRKLRNKNEPWVNLTEEEIQEVRKDIQKRVETHYRRGKKR